jgi:hypothetical protein
MPTLTKGIKDWTNRCRCRVGLANGNDSAMGTRPRLRVHTPTKKPEGGELTPEQNELYRPEVVKELVPVLVGASVLR